MREQGITLKELCQSIQLPENISEKVLEIETTMDKDAIQPYLNLLFTPTTWMEGVDQLKDFLKEDVDGLIMLTSMLLAALKSYERYQMLGISDQIYFNTFACFTRFVKEHKESYGTYGFDRGWWTVRQLSLKLFRIDTLEYEMIETDGVKELSIHIPSDAVLTTTNCRVSYEAAVNFFAYYYKEFQYQYMSCHSWLLSPVLKEVLSEDSKILQFQKSFQITKEFPEDKDYLEWVYQRSKLPLEELPENTSLQRNLKEYLLKGNQVGTAYGVLDETPFLEKEILYGTN